jgi:hypothetical protein
MRPPRRLLALFLVLASATPLRAHSGPPFPIVSNQRAGAYEISIWTDPDTTDDGAAAGQFWVVTTRTDRSGPPPMGTRAVVTVQPLDRSGAARSATTAPVRDDIGNQFAGVVLDHEGRFAVHVAIDGPLGPAAIDSAITATYDMRPTPMMMVVYVLPFLLVGFLWTKQLFRRRSARST